MVSGLIEAEHDGALGLEVLPEFLADFGLAGHVTLLCQPTGARQPLFRRSAAMRASPATRHHTRRRLRRGRQVVERRDLDQFDAHAVDALRRACVGAEWVADDRE